MRGLQFNHRVVATLKTKIILLFSKKLVNLVRAFVINLIPDINEHYHTFQNQDNWEQSDLYFLKKMENDISTVTSMKDVESNDNELKDAIND